MLTSKQVNYLLLILIVGLIGTLVFQPLEPGAENPTVPVTSAERYQDAAKLPILPDHSVRNVIVMIGDGMGTALLEATRLTHAGPEGLLGTHRMPITGMVKTNSADQLITDSAAAGTAMATGVKTNNGVIGQRPDGTGLRTILEACRDEAGKATGLVATSAITHATPASFAAHVDHRSEEYEIASQLIESRVDVLLGGGKKFFTRSEPAASEDDGYSGQTNADAPAAQKDLMQEAKSIGYTVIETVDALPQAKMPLLGLFAEKGLKGEPTEPTLAAMTSRAIELLSGSEDGFFLMVEGSQIDWECHDNKAPEAIERVYQFDQAVRTALAFAEKDQHTLVIVTSDHETGGLTITDSEDGGQKLELDWASGKHTATTVPLFAFGPHAVKFSGFHDNTYLPITIADILNIKDFPQPIESNSTMLSPQ